MVNPLYPRAPALKAFEGGVVGTSDRLHFCRFQGLPSIAGFIHGVGDPMVFAAVVAVLAHVAARHELSRAAAAAACSASTLPRLEVRNHLLQSGHCDR